VAETGEGLEGDPATTEPGHNWWLIARRSDISELLRASRDTRPVEKKFRSRFGTLYPSAEAARSAVRSGLALSVSLDECDAFVRFVFHGHVTDHSQTIVDRFRTLRAEAEREEREREWSREQAANTARAAARSSETASRAGRRKKPKAKRVLLKDFHDETRSSVWSVSGGQFEGNRRRH
jgi:hypothetical protein